MDRALILEHLDLAEQHVAQGKEHVTRQREIVAELKRDSHDSALAEQLLTQFEELLAMHVSDRARLRDELRELDARNEPRGHDK